MAGAAIRPINHRLPDYPMRLGNWNPPFEFHSVSVYRNQNRRHGAPMQNELLYTVATVKKNSAPKFLTDIANPGLGAAWTADSALAVGYSLENAERVAGLLRNYGATVVVTAKP